MVWAFEAALVAPVIVKVCNVDQSSHRQLLYDYTILRGEFHDNR